MISEFILLLIIGFIVAGTIDWVSLYHGKQGGAVIWMILLTIMYGIGRFIVMWYK